MSIIYLTENYKSSSMFNILMTSKGPLLINYNYFHFQSLIPVHDYKTTNVGISQPPKRAARAQGPRWNSRNNLTGWSLRRHKWFRHSHHERFS